jgi:hypothetical protein
MSFKDEEAVILDYAEYVAPFHLSIIKEITARLEEGKVVRKSDWRNNLRFERMQGKILSWLTVIKDIKGSEY